MKETGILFVSELVRAIREDKKTQTRRLVRSHVSGTRGAPVSTSEVLYWDRGTEDPRRWVGKDGLTVGHTYCPYGEPGDRLWVRETWHPSDSGPVLFAADYDSKEHAGVRRWYPGIHLRKVDARIWLELTDVRLERLQDITEPEARAEGVTPFPADPEGDCWADGKYKTAFEYKWGEINGWEGQPKARAPWATNPWVWALTFRRLP